MLEVAVPSPGLEQPGNSAPTAVMVRPAAAIPIKSRRVGFPVVLLICNTPSVTEDIDRIEGCPQMEIGGVVAARAGRETPRRKAMCHRGG